MSEHVQTGTFAEAYREVPFHVHKYQDQMINQLSIKYSKLKQPKNLNNMYVHFTYVSE